MSEEKKTMTPIADIFDQKLLSKIKEERISPKPRWHFLLKNYVIWIIGSLALLIGAGAVSVLTYLMTNNDLGIRHEINKTWGEVLLLTLPYFWLILLGLLVFVIYYNIKHTKRGYRYPLWSVLLASILASIILGEALFLFGVGEKIDGILGRRAPLYEFFINPQLDFWSRPEEGRLVGVPLQFFGDERFILVDRDQKEWEIIPASSTVERFLEKRPFAPEMMLDENEPLPPIRLIGKQISEQEFTAEIIIPLLPGRAFFDRPGHGPNPSNGSRCLENKNNKKNNERPCVLEGEGTMRSHPSPNN